MDSRGRTRSLEARGLDVAGCRSCPRLVDWREHVGREKRAAYAEEDYWARGVPGFGDPDARLLVVDDASHNVMLDQPETFATALASFAA